MGENVWSWSKTAATNSTVDSSISWSEGQTAGSVNNSARSVMAAVAKMRDDQSGAITLGGGTTAYTLTTNQVLGVLANGVRITAKVNATNTGASTLAVDGLTAKSIRKVTAAGEVAAAAGDLIIGQHAEFTYDTAANAAAGGWILRDPRKPGSGVTGTTDNALVRMDGTDGTLQSSSATINDSGTLTANLVRGTAFSYAAAVVLADDTATSFAINTTQAALILICSRGTPGAGFPNGLYYYSPNTPIITLIAGGSTDILLTTGILAGTTHTDANFNISAHTDGNLYLENRMGSSRTVNVAVFAFA